jgi:hypothetical protein
MPEAVAGMSPIFLPQGEREFMPLKEGGVSVSSIIERPLTEVLQAATRNRLKINIYPKEGVLADRSNFICEFPPDLDENRLLCSGSLNPEWLKMSGNSARLSAIVCIPELEYANGTFVRELPSRRHGLSPLVMTPEGELLLQHTWTCVTILWQPDALQLSGERGGQAAELDVRDLKKTIQMGLTADSFLFPERSTAVSEMLERRCDELEKIINAEDVKEAKVQEFFERGSNRFLLHPYAKEIFPRRSLGKYVPDFICEQARGDYHFIEIEDPKKPIYQEKGEEQASHLTHAIHQVEDWLRYVDDNRDTVQREDGLKEIYKPTGEVIAGRDAHLGETAKRRFDFKRGEPGKVTVRTYDMLLSDCRTYVATLKKHE